MKHILSSAALLLIGFCSSAQNVGIGTTSFTPNDDALLELRSTSSGFLLPKMTEAQKNAISGPTEGLIVYQTNATKGFKYFNGSVWTEFGGGADNFGSHEAEMNISLDDHWLSNDGGNEGIRIADNGNVGIGVSAPSNKLAIAGSNTDTSPILALLSGNNNTGFNNGAQISFGYNGTPTYQHFIQTRHNNGSSTNNAIDFYVSDGTQNNSVTSGSIHVMSLNGGNVGIGTTSPTKQLQVVSSASNANVVSIQSTANNGWSSMDFLNQSGALSATFGFANAGTSGIFTSRAYMNSYNNDFVLTRNSSETNIFISGSNGNVGIGTATPAAKFHAKGTVRLETLSGSGTRMVVADNLGNVSTQSLPEPSPWTVVGADVVRTSGQVGIGTSTPLTNLDLYGNGTSGFVLGGTTMVPNPAEGPEIGFGRGGFSNPGASIQMIDYDGYSAGLAFIVKRGVANGAGGVFANNFPNDAIQALTIINTGNIGVGTSNPVAKLHVSGDARISDLAGSGTRMVVANANGDLSTQAIPSGGGGSSSAYGVNGTGSQSTSSSSYSNISDMSLNLDAGTYILQFNTVVNASNSSSMGEFGFRVNGSVVSASERDIEPDNNEPRSLTVTCVVTVNSTSTVYAQFRKSSGSGSITVGNRCFTAIKIS